MLGTKSGNIFGFIAGLLLLLITTVNANANSNVENQTAQAQLMAFAKNLNSFKAEFKQTIQSQNGHWDEPVTGQFTLARPNLFRWDYQGDFPQQIVGDGEQIWIYDVELEQVSVKLQAQTIAESPALVLIQPQDLDKYFVVKALGSNDGVALMASLPKAPDPTFDRILLGFKDNLPVSLVIEDAFGQRTEIHFSQPRMNLAIDEKVFTFTPPPGADIIGEAVSLKIKEISP